MDRLSQTHTRRSFLATASGVTAASLTGCMGGSEGEGSDSIELGFGAQGTMAAVSGQALQSVVDEHAEEAEITGQTSEGYPSNLFLHDDGQIDGYAAGPYVIWMRNNELGQFSERYPENIAPQGFTLCISHIHILAVEGSGIETYDDLEGEDIWLFPPAWGMYDLTSRLFDNIGMWENLEPNVSEMGVGDLAGAVDEGRIQAFGLYGLNYNNIGGAFEDAVARSDFTLVEMSDEFKDAVDEQEGTSYEAVETDAIYGNNDETFEADTIDCYNFDVNLYFDTGVPNNEIKEICEISHNNFDELRNADPNYLDHSDLSNMTAGINDVLPVHGGVAEFLKENDAWNDSWEEA